MIIRDKTNANFKSISRVTLNFVLSMTIFLNNNEDLMNIVNDLIDNIVIEEKNKNCIIMDILIPIELYNDIFCYFNTIQNVFESI